MTKWTMRWAAAAVGLVVCQGLAARELGTWIGTWVTSPAAVMTLDKIGSYVLPPLVTLKGSVRYRVRVSSGGQSLRLRLSNEYGDVPLHIESVSVGIAAQGLDAVPGSLRPATFGGTSAVTIPAGAPVVTDAIGISVRSHSDLIVTVYVPGGISARATTGTASTDTQGVEGSDLTRAETFRNGQHLEARPLVSAIDVLVDRRVKVAVMFGDSITDGAVDPATGERGWPGAVARRLGSRAVSVVNAGIGGNRLLQTQSFFGRSALARLDQDVLSVPGLSYLVVLEGINDIGMSGPGGVFGDTPLVEAEQLVAAYRQIIERAHERGIRVYGGTLLPFEGAFYYSAEKEAVREKVNEVIRTSGMFDGVIDFDAAVRDPAQPLKLKADCDSGDHLHPGATGYRTMGDAVNLRLFD